MKKAFFIILASILTLAVFAAYQHFTYYDGKLHIVICNVGQGDGIYIKTPSGLDILVDGGGNSDMLRCLEDRMRFFDENVDIVFLTHPHLDHFYGLISVVERYTLKYFVTENIQSKNSVFQQFTYQQDIHKVNKKYVIAGDKFVTADGVTIIVLGPSREYVEYAQKEEKPDLNEGSLVLLLSYGGMDVLLTGDTAVEDLSAALEGHNLPSIELLKVPHHGSRFGLDQFLVEKIDPSVSVISVGQNRYGHPAPTILKLLEGRKVLRTDVNGTVEVVSDGKSFSIKTEK